ncbi:single-stranded DNA-binding protein [Thioalkalivibrio paradoxus]|uniref:Single-stranded DNA-binding protein n=1 Tax=Thioalkalivibrio paradoxus ARh 1 TaxID=713585 RepID=W0DRA7_9GAMM|nr:single-stranded DNA-binding protein [Thioalkalivibrio paradoxus]AHE99390.1 single-stranded DNA-binding protein [Thioalkalivibrio paradoxus ARh 1]
MIYASVHGRLGADPVAGETKTGKLMVRASVAVDVTPHNAEEPETLWVSLLAFGAAAEALDRAAKGEMVTAQGRMTRGHYTGRDGALRESWTLIPDAVLTARSARPSGKRRATA